MKEQLRPHGLRRFQCLFDRARHLAVRIERGIQLLLRVLEEKIRAKPVVASRGQNEGHTVRIGNRNAFIVMGQISPLVQNLDLSFIVARSYP